MIVYNAIDIERSRGEGKSSGHSNLVGLECLGIYNVKIKRSDTIQS